MTVFHEGRRWRNIAAGSSFLVVAFLLGFMSAFGHPATYLGTVLVAVGMVYAVSIFVMGVTAVVMGD